MWRGDYAYKGGYKNYFKIDFDGIIKFVHLQSL